MKEYDAYLFDADGTLIDSRELIFQSFVEMGRAVGATLPDRGLIESTVGLPMYKQIVVVLGDGHDDEYYRRGREAYGKHMMTIYRDYLTAFPGVKEGLLDLKNRGKKLAVVTSRRVDSLAFFLEFLGINDCFDLLVTPESTDRHKPDPDPALFAARELGVPPDRCLFIGDATFDVQCGKGAGMDVALVRWGGMDPTDWPVQPDVVVDEFKELLPEG